MIQSVGLKQLPPEVLELLWFLILIFELTFLNISPLSLLLGSTCAKIHIISPLLEVLGMICSFLPVYDVAALEMVSCPFAH